MDEPAHETKRRKPPGKETGKRREELYAAAYTHMQKAIDAGYFLEAITICESIIGDRLEARLAQIHQQEPDARNLLTLEKLTKRLAQDETGGERPKELYKRVRLWTDKRNKALHQMVKLSDDWNVPWETRAAEAKQVAKEGKELTREVDKLLRKLNPYQR
jgi:hypothetical protein